MFPPSNVLERDLVQADVDPGELVVDREHMVHHIVGDCGELRLRWAPDISMDHNRHKGSPKILAKGQKRLGKRRKIGGRKMEVGDPSG